MGLFKRITKEAKQKKPISHGFPAGHKFVWSEVEDFMGLNVASKDFVYEYKNHIQWMIDDLDLESIKEEQKKLAPYVPKESGDYFPSEKDSENVLEQKKEIALRKLPNGSVLNCNTYGEASLLNWGLIAAEIIVKRNLE